MTGLWGAWQDLVQAALPHFARSPLYVDQDHVDQAELEAIAARFTPDPVGQMRDAAHGARVFHTTALGPVTRMWIDARIEIDFLQRTLGRWRLFACDVLDIGAGYGRLAVMLQPFVRSYTCVDSVPVSTEVCRSYVGLYAPQVRVVTPETISEAVRPTLAINVHSWNECTLAQIESWLDVLSARDVPMLFTVSHTADYRAWDGQTFRPLLEQRYRLIAEEAIGLGRSPHALWERR